MSAGHVAALHAALYLGQSDRHTDSSVEGNFYGFAICGRCVAGCARPQCANNKRASHGLPATSESPSEPYRSYHVFLTRYLLLLCSNNNNFIVTPANGYPGSDSRVAVSYLPSWSSFQLIIMCHRGFLICNKIITIARPGNANRM